MQSNRVEIKHVIQCKFCGGKNCEYEDYTKWKSKKNTHIAIEGLFSNWITDHIIATQRPSSRLIKEHNIIQQFKDKQVNAIINLQLAGEHPECGDGLARPDGFSYLPEEFMDYGIFFYNFGWEDLTTPPFDLALSAAQVIDFTIRHQKRRVAIHCHAGLGRTGTIIACYLHMYEGMSPSEAIDHVRKRRPKSLQTKEQTKFVAQFAEYVANLRTSFYPSFDIKTSIEEVIQKQRKYLHGEELEMYRIAPRVLVKLCNRLKEVKKLETTAKASEWDDIHLVPLNADQQKRIVMLKKEINNDIWKTIDEETDPLVLMELLSHWMKHLKEPILSPEAVNKIATCSSEKIDSVLSELEVSRAHALYALVTKGNTICSSAQSTLFKNSIRMMTGISLENMSEEEDLRIQRISLNLWFAATVWKP